MNVFYFLFNSIIIYFVLNNKIIPEGCCCCCSSCFNIDSKFSSSNDGSMKENNITTKPVVKPVANEELFTYVCRGIEAVIEVLQYFFDKKIKSIFNFSMDLKNDTNYGFVREQLSKIQYKIIEKCTRHPNLGYKDVEPGQYYDLMCILKDSTINIDKKQDFEKTQFNIQKLLDHLKASGDPHNSNFFDVFKCSMHRSKFGYNLSKAISPIGICNKISENINSPEFEKIRGFLLSMQDNYDRNTNKVIEYFEIVFDDYEKVAIQDTNENHDIVSSFINLNKLDRINECE